MTPNPKAINVFEQEDISVVICVYNMEKYLDACLASVWLQTLKPSEVVVVDDCSTDRSLQIAEQWKEKLPITIINNSINSGIGVSRGIGCKNVRSEYIAFLDADDLWIPEHLAVLAELKSPKKIVSPKAIHWQNGKGLDRRRDYFSESPKMNNQMKEILKRNFVFAGSLFHIQLLADVGGYPTCRMPEDYIFWIRAIAHQYEIVKPTSATVLYRRHDKNLSGNSSDVFKQISEALTAEVELVPEKFRKYLRKSVKINNYREKLSTHDERESEFMLSMFKNLMPVIVLGPWRMKLSSILRIFRLGWNRSTKKFDNQFSEV